MHFEATFLHFDPCICIWGSRFCIHKSKMTQKHAFFGHVFAKTAQIFEWKSHVFVQKTQKIAFSAHTFDQKGLFSSSKCMILFLETIYLALLCQIRPLNVHFMQVRKKSKSCLKIRIWRRIGLQVYKTCYFGSLSFIFGT